MKMQKFVYEGKLEGDILVLGRTDCEKTTFVQKACRKWYFRKLEKAEWYPR